MEENTPHSWKDSPPFHDYIMEGFTPYHGRKHPPFMEGFTPYHGKKHPRPPALIGTCNRTIMEVSKKISLIFHGEKTFDSFLDFGKMRA